MTHFLFMVIVATGWLGEMTTIHRQLNEQAIKKIAVPQLKEKHTHIIASNNVEETLFLIGILL